MRTNLPQPAHAFKAPGRILEILVVQPLDSLADPDRLFHRPGRVGIEPQPVLGKSSAKGTHHLDIVVRMKHPALELVGLEAMAGDKTAGVGDDLVGSGLPPRPVAASGRR